MIRVLIDASPLKTAHRHRGIGFYTRHLIEALKVLEKKEAFRIFLADEKKSLEGIDLVHYPYFDLFKRTLPLAKKKETVVTIHDVIPLLFPKHYPPGIKGGVNFRFQKQSLKNTKAIITDSESSRKDIIRYLGVSTRKIFPIYLAPSKIFKPVKSSATLGKVMEKYHLPEKFVLYVGDVNYHKNVLGLAEACKSIRVPLVIVGKQAKASDFDHAHPENQPLVGLIKQYGRDPEVIRLGFVDDDDLVAIYKLASVYCQPSFYEGFGLPVLEAMACGAPIVAAKTGSLPEICGSAALMTIPKTKFLAAAIKKVLQNPSLRNKLAKEGYEQVKKFSWEKTAKETLTVYREVLKR